MHILRKRYSRRCITSPWCIGKHDGLTMLRRCCRVWPTPTRTNSLCTGMVYTVSCLSCLWTPSCLSRCMRYYGQCLFRSYALCVRNSSRRRTQTRSCGSWVVPAVSRPITTTSQTLTTGRSVTAYAVLYL